MIGTNDHALLTTASIKSSVEDIKALSEKAWISNSVHNTNAQIRVIQKD